MFGLRKKVSENLIIFVLASFVFMSILGMGEGMQMKDGHMSSCPFTAGQETACQMNITEHITQWQHVFSGIPTKTNSLAFAIVLLVAISVLLIKPFPQLKRLVALTVRFLAYHRANFAKVFDPLLIAFSDGILNPKIYEFANI